MENKKVAIFVEGQTEQIFIKKLLQEIYGYANVQIQEHKTTQKYLRLTIQTSTFPYFYLLVNTQNDESVVSIAIENYENLLAKGYSIKIFCIRDLYPNSRTDKDKVLQTLSKLQKKLKNGNISQHLKIILAIMEIEAWFLADPSLFEKINPILTSSYIHQKLNYNLLNDDPEIAYKHPAAIIDQIYNLVNNNYGKHEHDTYTIVENISYPYLCLDIPSQNKISSFCMFLAELESI